MVSVDMLRRLLEVADARRDPYALAAVCAGLLEANPQDGQAARHYVRALAALEMGGAARRILEQAAPVLGAQSAEELRTTLTRLPAGVIPWSSRRRRFQANLRALEGRGVAVNALVQAWDDPAQNNAERYELHQASDGNFHILDTDAGRQAAPQGANGPAADVGLPWKCWLGGFENLKGVIASIPPESFKSQLRGPLAFDGVGHGWLIPHILQISENAYLNYSLPIYIVEPDLISFCMALHLHDLQSWLRGPRLRIFLGESARDQFLKALQENPAWTLPSSFAFSQLRPRPDLKLQAAIEQMLARRAENRRTALERIAVYYGAFDGAAWRNRFAEAAQGGPPLRVLGITTRFSTVLRYSMEELQTAAETCGIPMQMSVCIEPDDQSLEKDYIGMIDRLKPDLLVSISRMRYEMPDLPRNIPALCWDQDNLQCMREPGALADMQGLTFVAGHGAVFGSMHLNWPVAACIFCHPAGRTHHYRPGPLAAGEEAEFGADVSYVSHAAGVPEQLRDQLRAKWRGGAGEFVPLFDACSSEIINSCRQGRLWEFLELQKLIRTLAAQAKLPLPDPVWHALMIDLRLLVDRVFRHETLAWVANWCESRNRRLRLWGNGWDQHPTLAKWAAGVALPGEQAQSVFRASKINLQIIETGILHSRLLDGWAAGGFFLMRQAHRTQDEERMLTCYAVGQMATEEGIERLVEIQAKGSDKLNVLWQSLAPEYASFNQSRIFPGFRIWQSLVPPQLLLPQLPKIMFRSADEFEKMGDLYISSEKERQAVYESIRDTLEQHLSYNARWRDFIGHLSANLGYGNCQARRNVATK